MVHRDTGVVMVLKSLYRMDPKCENDFLKEAAFMRQLCHPNVVRFLGILYKEKKVHIISEFVSGGSLRSHLDDEERPLPWTLRTRISADVSSGMVRSIFLPKRFDKMIKTKCTFLGLFA